MQQLCLELQDLKPSKPRNNKLALVFRYWFQWINRKNRSAKPCLEIQHIKTSKQRNDKLQTVIRYWFQWGNRTNLSTIVIRLELLDIDGNKVTEAIIPLPKAEVTGYIPGDFGYEKPFYDIPVWIKLDDIVREIKPVSFRFYTVEGVFKKSETATGLMDGAFDDISDSYYQF